MRHFALALLVLLSGCVFKSIFEKGPDYSPYLAHHCDNFRKTPKGHLVCNDPKGSVLKGFATEAEIDQAVDAAWDFFRSRFPEYPAVEAACCTTDRYAMWIGQWAAGAELGKGAKVLYVCLWSRGTSATDPGNVWEKRPPGTNEFGDTYPTWRYTAKPLVPALAHEALHAAIGDPAHGSPLWQRLK